MNGTLRHTGRAEIIGLRKITPPASSLCGGKGSWRMFIMGFCGVRRLQFVNRNDLTFRSDWVCLLPLGVVNGLMWDS